jgi:hypothetical protein
LKEDCIVVSILHLDKDFLSRIIKIDSIDIFFTVVGSIRFNDIDIPNAWLSITRVHHAVFRSEE